MEDSERTITIACSECEMPLRGEPPPDGGWVLTCGCRYWTGRRKQDHALRVAAYKRIIAKAEAAVSRSAEGSEHFAPDDLKFHDETERGG